MRDDRRLNALARGRLRAQRSAAPRAVEAEASRPAWLPAVAVGFRDGAGYGAALDAIAPLFEDGVRAGGGTVVAGGRRLRGSGVPD